MDEINPATEANAPTIAPEEDMEAKYAQLETEKENYRKAYLKEAEKNKGASAEIDEDEITRKVNEAIANSKLADIAREQDEIIKKALKENKELKLAQLNGSKAPPAAMGAHSEGTPVRDTIVTPEQMAYFKSRGWDDKKIALYKENLLKKR